ncbi:alpha/beta hydrolase [Kitasatospora sp. NPDC048540]|uniref:alpha/beta fold hydrolase n=1 Tax=unclassified Kitasatospora TaxID=2633591 RepID=UPI00056BED4A|nr:alpha/beta hydrolase [Kitasatospora sp. MBT63]
MTIQDPVRPGRPVIRRIGGLPLHVRREGTGPVCLLTSGLGGCWFDWDPVVPLLTPHRTVIRFDRPGYGLSGPAPAAERPGPAGEAHRIAAVLDALGEPGPVTVAGHSLAAFHVEAFARLYPDRTAALVLLDGSVEEDPRPRPAPGLRDAAARLLAAALTAAAAPYLCGPAARRLVVRQASLRGREEVPADLLRRCYRPGRALRALLRENTAYLDDAAALAALRTARPLPDAPVTVLAAARTDGSPWLVRQRALAARLGGAFRTAVPAGHLLMIDAPAEVAAAILGTSRPG